MSLFPYFFVIMALFYSYDPSKTSFVCCKLRAISDMFHCLLHNVLRHVYSESCV